MKIIIAPTWVQADQARRDRSLPRRETVLVSSIESAHFAFGGRTIDAEDLIDLGRPTDPAIAETIDVLVATRVRPAT